MLKRLLVAVILGAVLAACSSSGSPKYVATPTAVTVVSSSVVGVAFNVKNTGTAAGSPNCVVTAAVTASNGGTHGVVLGSIKPGQIDYESASSDDVTLSGGDAAGVSLSDGGVSIACS